ncbi:MAG TPA: hypothetical protein VFD58_23500 [Blastocatellia bacterium]|nr:hypothetical protein [Blastocatellia bacterium]
MFCPGCGIQVNHDLKFCKQCGANLRGVQEVMTARPPGEKFDWSKTWVAEMFLSSDEWQRREQEYERLNGVTPAIKSEISRLNEIKGGVITSAVGVGLMIFLYHLLDAVANLQQEAAAGIIRQIWNVGWIPFFVGLALTFNGLFVSRRIARLKAQQESRLLSSAPVPTPLSAKATDQLAASAGTPPADFSVTENTTANLPDKINASPRRETR